MSASEGIPCWISGKAGLTHYVSFTRKDILEPMVMGRAFTLPELAAMKEEIAQAARREAFEEAKKIERALAEKKTSPFILPDVHHKHVVYGPDNHDYGRKKG